MKKKLNRKLTLNKETVRLLDNGELGQVNGATMVETNCDTCRTMCGTCSCTKQSCAIPCPANCPLPITTTC